MSVIPSASWQTTRTPDYFTRQEAFDFFSSAINFISAGGLSSINFPSTINFNTPNPTFSTINMNPTGSINMNDAPLLNAKSLGVSSIGSLQPRQWNANQNAVSVMAVDNSSMEPLQAQLLALKAVVSNTNNKGLYLDDDGVAGATNDLWNGLHTYGLQWLGSNGGNKFALNNISTINGTPPNTTNTTFTTLTGNILQASQLITTPVLANLSTVNGLPKVQPFIGTWAGSLGGVPNAIFASLFTINIPYNIPPNQQFLVSVLVQIGSFASGSPTSATFDLGLRVGGAGTGATVGFQNIHIANTALPNGAVTYCLTANVVSPTASTTNTIEICSQNGTGVSYTCVISPPPGAGRWTLSTPY